MRLRAIVAMTGKADDDQCRGFNVVHDDVRLVVVLPNLHGPSARPAKERREKRMMLWLVPVWITEMTLSS